MTKKSNVIGQMEFERIREGDLGTQSAEILLTIEFEEVGSRILNQRKFKISVNCLGIIRLLSNHNTGDLMDLLEFEALHSTAIKKFAKDCIKAHNFLNQTKGF
jgi:hypothetical protein